MRDGVAGVLLMQVVWGHAWVLNAPISQDLIDQNVLVSSYLEGPKHLDSASSYSSNETTWTYAVYEPPLKYHYLKRPYEVEPKTLVQLPQVTYLDQSGRELHFKSKPLSASDQQKVAVSVFELKLQKGILFAPHPAFAKTDNGELLYSHLSAADLKDKKTPYDFPKTTTTTLNSLT